MIAAPAIVPTTLPLPPEQAAAADDDRGNHVELQADGDRRIADRQLRELQKAGERRRAPPRSCRPRSWCASMRDAAQPRRALVRTDREQVPAEARVAQRERRRRARARTPARCPAAAEARRRPRACAADRSATSIGASMPPLVRQSLRRAAHQQHRPQRHDERDDLQLRDQQAVDQAADRAGGDARRAPRRTGRRSARSSSAVTTVLSATIEPTERSIPPRDDHHRHAERGDADDGRLPRHQLEVGGAEELRADEHAEDAARRATSPSSTPRSSSSRRAVTRPRARRARPSAEQCSVHSATGRGRSEPAARHHRDAIAHAEQLRQIAADQQHGFRPPSADVQPTRARRSSAIDLRLAGDVDAARRLVEHEHVDVVVQQPRHRHLLLVAARELAQPSAAGPRTDRQPIDPAARGAASCRDGDTTNAGAAERSSRVSVRLSATLRPSASPSPLRSSLSRPMPCRHAIVRRGAARIGHADA